MLELNYYTPKVNILIKWKILYINARLELTFKSIFKLAAKGKGRKELTEEEEQTWPSSQTPSKEREKLKGIFGIEKNDKIEKR